MQSLLMQLLMQLIPVIKVPRRRLRRHRVLHPMREPQVVHLQDPLDQEVDGVIEVQAGELKKKSPREVADKVRQVRQRSRSPKQIKWRQPGNCLQIARQPS